MAVPTDTFEAFTAIGMREDLSDVIYNIDPFDTPFMSSIPVTDATAVLHEWQTDALAAAVTTNQVAEGLDAVTNAATVTVRLTNRCEISDKVPRVSGTLQSVLKAGRGDELEYQIAKMAKELKIDMESSMLAERKTAVTGSSGTARQLGSIGTWVFTNNSEASGATASTGAGTNARTAGTARAFTETMLKTVVKNCWDNGGDPDCLMVDSFNKQAVSGFTGNATREVNAMDKALYAAIDVYDSDFGELQVFPNRFMAQATSDTGYAAVLQKDMFAVAYLRQFQLHDLAKTGDSERRQLLVEFTMESRNEKASGLIADLSTS